MTNKTIVEFAEHMLSESKFLQDAVPVIFLEDLRHPDEPTPIVVLGVFGSVIAELFDVIPASEWQILVQLIEEGLASSDDNIVTAVATGLLEGLVHKADQKAGQWAKIAARLGPEGRYFAESYRNHDF